MNGTRTQLLAHLDALAEALQATALDTERHYTQQQPFLLAANPELVGVEGAESGPVLSERITAHRQEGGVWRFHWSWGDPLGPVSDLPGAICKITRTLIVPELAEVRL